MQMHELLHVLGFGHSENPSETMFYRYNTCDAVLGNETIRSLKRLYGIYDYVDGTKIIDYPGPYFN